MGFGQGGIERVKSVKINRDQLNNRKREGYFKSTHDSKKTLSDFVDHKKMSREEFEVFKKTFTHNERKRKRKLYLSFAITTILIVTLMIYLLINTIL